jgi:hypothetical protein
VPTAEKYISVRWSEDLLRADPPDRAEPFDLSACEFVQIGAAWRLAAAMHQARASGGLHVVVPALDNARRWFLSFTRTGLAHAVARYAARVTTAAGDDVTQELELRYPDGEFAANNFACDTGLRQMQDIEPIARFARVARQRWWPAVNITAHTFPQTAEDALLHLCHEAVENIVDHAYKRPYQPSPVQAPSIALSYYSANEPGVSAGAFTQFLATAEQHGTGDLRGFLEIVVRDDGVGVAARQALDASVYSEPVDAEQQIAADAFARGSTIKLRAGDCEIRGQPGFGFSNIFEHLRKLGAYAQLRSGRLSYVFDGSGPRDAAEALAVQAPAGFLPGTVLNIVVPVHDPQLVLL